MKDFLLSVVTGDMCGVPYEFRKNRIKNEAEIDLHHPKQHFSDDSVCTFAVAAWLLQKDNPNAFTLETSLRDFCGLVPGAGYGGMFRKWLADKNMGPYGSYGNGSAMRVSAVALIAKSEEEVLSLAEETCQPTHNHPGAIAGAQAAALISYRILHGSGKEAAKEILDQYYPEWTISYEELRKKYCFMSSAQETVPAAIIAFLKSSSFEDCIIKNIALGGDADTLCAIACPWAYAYYKEMPEDLVKKAWGSMPTWMKSVNEKMNAYVKGQQ